MLKAKYILMLMVAFSATVSSCKKEFLERLPPTTLTPEQALSNLTDLQTAMRGAYAGLRATDLFGRSVPVFGDLLADNGYVSTTNSNRYLAYQQYNYTVATGEIANFWSNAYTVILRCNNIINSSLAASPAVNQVKGEAYAVRALC